MVLISLGTSQSTVAWGGEEEEYFDEGKARDRLLKEVLRVLKEPMNVSDLGRDDQVDDLGKILAKPRHIIDTSDLMDHEYIIGDVVRALAEKADFAIRCEEGDYLFFFREVGNGVITGKYVFVPNDPDDYSFYVGDFKVLRHTPN